MNAAALLSLLPLLGPQQEDVAHAAYRAQMAAAESALRLGESADARGWLAATDPARRGFEWRVRDAQLDQALASWPVDGGVSRIAVAPDGSTLACGAADGTLALRAADSFELRASVAAHADGISQVQFDRESARIVTASYDRTVKIWSVPELALLMTFEQHAYPVAGAAFSPDGLHVASCSYERPENGVVGTLHLWNAADGEIVRTMHGGRKPLVDLWFSPDGRRIAAGSWDFCVFAWDVAGGEPMELAVPDEGIYNAVDGAAWSPDGAFLAGASKDRTARVWNAADGKLVATLRGHTDHVAKIAYSPDGKVLATASRDGTLKLWDTADWTERATLNGHADDVVDVAFTPDGSRIWSCASDETVRAWDARTHLYGGAKAQATHASYVVRFSPDGERLATCSYDGRVQVWSAENLAPLTSWQAHPDDKSCHALDWSPDGRSLYTGSHDGTVGIFDSVTGAERARLEHEDGVGWLDVSPDGRRVAVASGKQVIVWDAAEARRSLVFEGHSAGVSTVAFSPDSALCVSSGRDGKALVWSVEGGAQRLELTGVGTNVASTVFTPDGEYLVVGGRGGQVALHRASDGAKVRDLVRNRHGFAHLAISPDGARVALAADTVTLVDVLNGGVVGQLRPHTDGPYHVEFDPRGERLASCSTDGSIAITDTRKLSVRLASAPAVSKALAAETLVFTATVDGNADLWSVTGGETRRLTIDPGVDNFPVPSPDGSWIAFQSQRDGSYDVFVMPLDGSAPPRKLVSGPAHDGLPVWSPDGSEIAFFSNRDLPPPELRTLPGHMYRVRLDGSGLKRLTQEPLGSTTGPAAWSADGRWLYFSRERAGSGLDLFRLDIETGVEHALGADPRGEYGIQLSPGGERLAFYQETADRCDVAVMRLDGSEYRTLTSEPGWHYVQSWSPDGEWLAVLSYSPDFASSRTWALRIADGLAQPLETLPGARELVWARR